MRIRHLLAVLLVALAVGFSPQAKALTIDFEIENAPDLFSFATPLTTLYADSGVTFSGVTGVGGYILSDSANFGIHPRSGTDFLAFNSSVGTDSFEKVSFDSPMNNFSVYVGYGDPQTYMASAYNSSNLLLTTAHISPIGGHYGKLSLSAQNISYVIFGTENAVFVADDFVADDLRVSSVPLPPALSLFIAALGGLAFFGSKKKRSSIL